MFIDFLLDVFRKNPDADAIVWNSRAYPYRDLLAAIERWGSWLDDKGVQRGEVVSLEADFSVQSIALMLTLIERGCCVVPLTASVQAKKAEFRDIAQVERIIEIDARDQVSVR